jgi:hypothetical protein
MFTAFPLEQWLNEHNINFRKSRFQTRSRGIMVTNNKYVPYDRSGTATAYYYTVNYTLTTN